MPVPAAGAVHEKDQRVRSALPFEKTTSQSRYRPVVPALSGRGASAGHADWLWPPSVASTPVARPAPSSKLAAKLLTFGEYCPHGPCKNSPAIDASTSYVRPGS